MPSNPSALAAAHEAVELAKKATPGPWSNSANPLNGECLTVNAVHTSGTERVTQAGNLGPCSVAYCGPHSQRPLGHGQRMHNARLIAHAGTHYATIAQALLAATEMAERYEKALEGARMKHDYECLAVDEFCECGAYAHNAKIAAAIRARSDTIDPALSAESG